MDNPTPTTAGSAGPAIDRLGAPVIDPTENVKALVDAGLRRQDDLRYMEAKHLRDLLTLRSEYEEKLRVAESNRIDAIRAVDVGAVARAAEVSSQQASTLAAQVALTAETARAGLATALQPITLAIEALRAAQYAQQGQQAARVDLRSDQTDHRGQSQWFITTIVGLVLAVGLFVANHMK
ncbi:MAG: hypothetical protein NVSMB64_18860 [Candidatus Velthaea sp.]